jgi:Na+-driven multidrug efflux pump
MSLGSSASALTGQNLGAGKPERIKEIFKWGVIMTSAITLLISATVITIPKLLLSMFLSDEKVLHIGTSYLLIQGGSYIFFAIMYIASGIANGAGHTAITMVFSLVSLWIVRVPSAAYLSRHTPLGLNGIWVAVVLSYFATMVVSLVYYFSGRWKKTAVSHAKAPKVT